MAEFDLQGAKSLNTKVYWPSLAVRKADEEKAMVLLLDTGCSEDGLALDEDVAERFAPNTKLELYTDYQVKIGALKLLKKQKAPFEETEVYEYQEQDQEQSSFEVEYQSGMKAADNSYMSVISMGFLKDNGYLGILSPKSEQHEVKSKTDKTDRAYYSDDIAIVAAKEYELKNTYQLPLVNQTENQTYIKTNIPKLEDYANDILWDTGATEVFIDKTMATDKEHMGLETLKPFDDDREVVIIPKLSVEATKVGKDNSKETITFKNVPALVIDGAGVLTIGSPIIKQFNKVIIGAKDDKAQAIFCVTL